MTEAILGRRERKKEETKRRIFVAALELFREKGFDDTTIDEITARADVAKGTFFNYFPRKEAVIEFLAEEQLESVEDTVHHSHSATEQLRTLYDAMSTGYEANPDLARAVVRASLERLCCPAEGGAWHRFEQQVFDVIRHGQESGEFRRELAPRAVHGALVSCFIGGVIWWLGEARESDDPRLRAMRLPDIIRALQGVALNGLRVEPEAAP